MEEVSESRGEADPSQLLYQLESILDSDSLMSVILLLLFIDICISVYSMCLWLCVYALHLNLDVCDYAQPPTNNRRQRCEHAVWTEIWNLVTAQLACRNYFVIYHYWFKMSLL